jgi:Fe2+ or Zn2+ uptake regulation protein
MDRTIETWDLASTDTVINVEANVSSELIFGARDTDIFQGANVNLLRRAGLRPTRQRLVLGWLLFSKGGRHVSAEMLHDEAKALNIHLSLATVYNTLHHFTEAGLLRQIGVDGSKSFFDTNPTTRHPRQSAGASARIHHFTRRCDRAFATKAGMSA